MLLKILKFIKNYLTMKNKKSIDKNELIKSYKIFYHITDAKNEKNILEKGLIPNRLNDMDYHRDCPNKKAQVCLTTKNKLKEILKSFQDTAPTNQYIIYEISADFIATTDFGLDWTYSGTEKLKNMNEIIGLKISIEEFGTLACFDIIPKEIIKKI